jgi:hypothetical protein
MGGKGSGRRRLLSEAVERELAEAYKDPAVTRVMLGRRYFVSAATVSRALGRAWRRGSEVKDEFKPMEEAASASGGRGRADTLWPGLAGRGEGHTG